MRTPVLIALPVFLILAPLISREPRERKYLPLAPPEVSAPAEPAGAQDTEEEAPAKPKLEALDFAPLSYYEGACARCHGNNGANYGDLLKGKSDAQLHDGIHAMAIGPGQSPLNDAQIDVMTRWHRALIENKPFVHLAKIEKSDSGKTILSGEATPDAKVFLKNGDQQLEATRDGAGWKIEAPADLDTEEVELHAQKETAAPEAAK
jgi:mono/diheme cytochrome c family protein